MCVVVVVLVLVLVVVDFVGVGSLFFSKQLDRAKRPERSLQDSASSYTPKSGGWESPYTEMHEKKQKARE